MREELPDKLPRGWTSKTIEELVEDHRTIGYGVLKPGPHIKDGIRLVKSNQVRDGHVDLSSDYRISAALDEEFKRTRLRGGELLLNVVGSIGRSAIAPQELEGANVSRAIAVLPLDKERAPWIQLFMSSPKCQADMFGRKVGIAQPVLNLGQVRKLVIPIPPLPTQRRIVAEIEKQFTRLEVGIAALQRVQANLKRYRAAVLKAACEGSLVPTEGEWKRTTLSELIVNIEAGRSFKCEERPPKADEVGVIKVSAVTWGIYNEMESKTCLNPERIEERFVVRPGDFLFSRANTIELIGACVIAKVVRLRVMLSDKILRFQFSPTVKPDWILYWLRSGYGRSEIERLATGNQMSMRNIGQDRIRQISVKLPSIDEQRKIVAEVERRLSVVQELEAVVAANLQRAARLRQSILQKAFAGELL